VTPQRQTELWASLPPGAWLAGADRERRHDIVIRWGWDRTWLAPLPCGVRWDALAMADALGLAVLKALRTSATCPALGPVLHDRALGLVHWLLPVEVGAAARWREVDSTLQLMTGGAHLHAPDPDPEPADRRSFEREWVSWPPVTGTLTPPDVLAAAISQHLAGRVA
jgi:hypothetical protein